MTEMHPISPSSSAPPSLETRAITIAAKEQLSKSEVVDQASRLYAMLPRELRELLLDPSEGEPRSEALYEEMARLAKFDAARVRFLEASRRMAAKGEIDGERLQDDEAVVIDSKFGSRLIVAHPSDFVLWTEKRFEISADRITSVYG